MDNNIPELLSTLREGEITAEFYEIVLYMAEGKHNREIGQGIEKDQEAQESALEFILYLKDNLGVGSIRTKADLNREFNRWITKTNSEEDHELWSILSEALLALEKEGKCSKGKGFEKYNNSNQTIWFLSGLKNEKPNLTNENRLISEIPSYSPVKRSVESKNQPKIIPPSSAQELVMHILKAVGGPISMSRIMNIAKGKVVLQQVVSLQPSGNNEKDDDDPIAKIPDRDPAFAVYIQEEIDHRAILIWEEVAVIERGRKEKIPGHKILCLYILPSEILKKPVNLETFGPTSTVNDVKSDVFNVLHKHLYFEEMLDSFDEGLFPTQVIKIKIIQEINRKCSENGYETGLDDIEDKEK